MRRRKIRDWYLNALLVAAIGAITFGAGADETPPASTPSLSSKPTYSRDVLPILQDHCQSCHRPSQSAPMSLTSYEEVRPWAKAIRKAVTQREMPPFAATGPIGRYIDDPRLTEAQIATIAQWVDQGSPRGNPEHAPPPKEWGDTPWPLGQPDLVLEYPRVELGPRDSDLYLIVHNDHIFETDLWIRAIDFLPLNFENVHHAGIFAVHGDDPIPPGFVEDKGFEKRKLLFQRQPLRTWLPGSRARLAPEGHAVRLSKGDRIVVQNHYAPGDEVVVDKTRIGLYFANGLINKERKAIASFMFPIEIPPEEPNYEYRERIPISTDAHVLGFEVHMHLRGKWSKILFHFPDGRVDTALHIPEWDFDWQRFYYLDEPIEVPKGTVAEFIAVWDNSAENPLNPDPAQTVTWGSDTTDEMYGGVVSYEPIEPRENPIFVKNGRVTKKR